MPVPLPRLALVAALSAPLIVAGASWFWIVDATLLLAFLVDVALATPVKCIGLERRIAASVTLGQCIEIVWVCTSRSRRSARLVVADALAPSLGAARRRFEMELAAAQRGEAVGELQPGRRGRFELGPVTVRSLGPLRLGARQRTVSVPGELRVLPPFRSRDEAELRNRRWRSADVGRRSVRFRSGGTEFEQMRDYTIDDEFRRIDWPATARSGKAVVRTYRAERNQTVVALLDCGRTMAGLVEGVPRLEHAMDAAMMLTAVATHLGDRVGLVAYDRDVRLTVTPSSSGSQLARISQAFADLPVQLVESDLRAAVVSSEERSRRRSLVVVFTELTGPTTEEVVIPGLAAMRHQAVFIVAVRDPELIGWSRLRATDPESAFRAAAAAASLAERRRCAARIRAAGAVVIDAEPDQLAARVADAYLEVKAAGRL